MYSMTLTGYIVCQGRFVRFVKTMYDRESDMMLTFLDDSRLVLNRTAQTIAEEQEELRQEASRISKNPIPPTAQIHRESKLLKMDIFVNQYSLERNTNKIAPFLPTVPKNKGEPLGFQ